MIPSRPNRYVCSQLGFPPPAIVTPPGAWEAFAKAGIIPDLSQVHFIARAITPPNRNRRFDSRFFAAEVSAIAHRADGFVGPDKELVELVWLPITEARRLDMPGITAIAPFSRVEGDSAIHAVTTSGRFRPQ